MTLREAFGGIPLVTFTGGAPPAVETVAACVAAELAPGAVLKPLVGGGMPPGGGRVHVASPAGTRGAEAAEPWMRLSRGEGGAWEIAASHAHLLYPFVAVIRDEWLDDESADCARGRTIRPSFPWLRNLSDFLVGSLRNTRGFSREEYFRQIARSGFSHVTINGLASDCPFETGPPGDVYSWFYDYSPDLDQFVDSTLLRGWYPPEYIAKNLAALKSNAALAARYGLIPGLHINSPRSMPEAFWEKYGFLRGARIDHPRESFRPRYTLAMAHPAVQAHYRELLRNMLREVPEIGFIHIWTNDSGSGFEFVTSLYAGRNGGPYLLREWKNDDEIARSAAGNVLTYYRLIRDECRSVNPGFRLICDIASFATERKYIVPSMGGGIDAGDFGSFLWGTSPGEQAMLDGAGAWTHGKVDLGGTNVIGVPFPWLLHERLMEGVGRKTAALLASPAPASMAPFDVNGEVLRAVQLTPWRTLPEVLERLARTWGGTGDWEKLVEIWRLSDQAVRSFPRGIPLSTFAYPWFRLSVRPFVADIGAIPESERAYYERFLLATFNNPARVDLNNDMMWNFLTVEEADENVRTIDGVVVPPLEAAIRASAPGGGRDVFGDAHDRLRAWRSYALTLRNMCAWTAGVHGYIRSADPEERARRRALCCDTASRELANARELLALWRGSNVHFMPVAATGESLHSYGENFGVLLEKKIRLMELHPDDEPYIDPAYMWRMPDNSH